MRHSHMRRPAGDETAGLQEQSLVDAAIYFIRSALSSGRVP
jgi:hypothetical protein